MSAEVQQERWERLMAMQQPISLARNQAQIGRQLTVLVEGHGDGLTLARSYRDAPEIDGFVLVEGILPVGAMVDVTITGAMAYDLVGAPVSAETKGVVSEIALTMESGRSAASAPTAKNHGRAKSAMK